MEREPMMSLAPQTATAIESADPVDNTTMRRRMRRRRGDLPRGRTVATKRLTKEEIREGISLLSYLSIARPSQRAACAEGIRPCPWVACKHHLYLDVNPETGSIKLNFPHLEVWEMDETCALDVADRSGTTLEEVGEIMNLTRERIRQVELAGLIKLRGSAVNQGLSGQI